MENKTEKSLNVTSDKTRWIIDFDKFVGEVESITICGAGPSLKKTKKHPEKGFVIFINSALNRFPIREHTSGVVRFVMTDRRFMLKNKSKVKLFLDEGGFYIAPNCSFVPFAGKNVLKYVPVVDTKRNLKYNRLRIGHSTLIPALHLALMINPKKIWLAGVDLHSCLHWEDDIRFSQTKASRHFPSFRRIVKEVKMLLDEFNYSEIYSISPRSLVVSQASVKKSNILEFEKAVCVHTNEEKI